MSSTNRGRWNRIKNDSCKYCPYPRRQHFYGIVPGMPQDRGRIDQQVEMPGSRIRIDAHVFVGVGESDEEIVNG